MNARQAQRVGIKVPCQLRVAQLSFAANVREVLAAELVRAGNINDHMPIVTKVGVLDDKTALPVLLLLDLSTDGMLWRRVE